MPLNLLVIGASGGTGRELVRQGLDAGHRVTAFVRTPSKMPLENSRVRLVTGSLPTDEAVLSDAILGQDVVISAIGVGQSLKSNGLIEQAVPAIIRAMRRAGVSRLIFISGIGVGTAVHDAPLFSRILIRLLLKDVYADKLIGENFVRHSDLDWTMLQPAQLTNGPFTGKYRSGEDLKLSGIPKISRADVAHFIVSHLTDRTCMRKIVRLGN